MTLGSHFLEVHSLQFDSEEKYLAASYTDGIIRIFNSFSGKISYTLNSAFKSEQEKYAFTCIRWRPQKGMKYSQILSAVSIDGCIYQWNLNMISGNNPPKLWMHKIIPEADLYCLDYNYDGTKFAVAGKLCEIKIFDEIKKECILDLISAGPFLPGHSNRIYSIKFTDEPNLLLSGGWDRTLKIWDLRNSQVVASIVGLEIASDTIDSKGDRIFAGNHRSSNTIQEFSLTKQSLINNYCWDMKNPSRSPLIYSLKLSYPSAQYLIACGSEPNEARIFDISKNCTFVCGISGLPKPCFATDFGPRTNIIAVGSADGYVRMYNWKE